MLTTNDRDVAEKVRLLRGHAMTKTAFERDKQATWFYDIVDLGYNYRLNEAQAALGISQLKRVDEANRKRIAAAKYYDRCLAEIPGIVVPSVKNKHVFHMYVVKVLTEEYGLSRDELFLNLTKRGIGLSVHYTPLHMLKYYRDTLGYQEGEFPVAERAYKEVLSLPLFPRITKQQIRLVSNAVREARAGKSGSGSS